MILWDIVYFYHFFWCCRLQLFRHLPRLLVTQTPHRIIQNIPPVDGQKSHGLLSAWVRNGVISTHQIFWSHQTGARYVVVSILNITSGWHILLTPAWFFTTSYYWLTGTSGQSGFDVSTRLTRTLYFFIRRAALSHRLLRF